MLKIRPSMLPSFADCERRAVAQSFRNEIADAGFKLRQLDRNIGACIGTAVHKGVERLLREKIDRGELGNLNEAVDAGIDSAREEIREGVFYDATTRGPDDVHRQVQRMVTTYRANLAPKLKPVYVETRLEVEFEGITVTGQTDVVTEEITETVRDTKTGATKRANQAQIGTYVLQRRSHGSTVTRAVEDWIPRVRIDKDQPPPLTYEYDLDNATWSAFSVLQRAVTAMNDFQSRVISGSAPPEFAFLANPSSMLCSQRWCAAWGTTFCREWRGD